MISASSFRRSQCSSPTRRTSAARSATVVAFDHSRWARSARAIASRSSSSVIVGYSLSVSPVAGSTTAYMLITSSSVVGLRPTLPRSSGRKAHRDLVAAHLLETLVADAKMVGDLVKHDVSDLAAQSLRIGTVEALERAAVDRDLVR